MTIELFRSNAYQQTCEANVVSVSEAGIVLDQTVCYPQGGGQAGDAGTLTLVDLQGDCSPAITLIDTRKDPDTGNIVHVPAPGQAWPTVGRAVRVQLDWLRRYQHMRFHTATHLLSALVPFPVNGCSITALTARLDFATGAEPLDRDALAEGLARLIAANHAVAIESATDAELDANPTLVKSMSVSPPRGVGTVRLIRVQSVDLQACGGTHVAHTGEIAGVVISKIEKLSALNRRIRLGWAA